MEAVFGDEQVLTPHVVAIRPVDVFNAAFTPGGQPGARCATDVEHTAQRQRLAQHRSHLHRRVPRRAGRVVHEMLVVDMTHDSILL
jgi:hypothetical protein